MSRYLTIRLSSFIQRLEITFSEFFGHGFPSEVFAVTNIQTPDPSMDFQTSKTSSQYSLKDLIGNGFLWAVPKARRTIEKRLKRKFGLPEYTWKLLLPKTNLRICNTCGRDHEVGVLCPHCYEKIRKETEEMQDKIQQKLGLQPIEQDVIVLYEGEKSEQPAEFLRGKRVVEMEKPRPMWFSKNLLQKSTQQPATTKEVKPNDLG